MSLQRALLLRSRSLVALLFSLSRSFARVRSSLCFPPVFSLVLVSLSSRLHLSLSSSVVLPVSLSLRFALFGGRRRGYVEARGSTRTSQTLHRALQTQRRTAGNHRGVADTPTHARTSVRARASHPHRGSAFLLAASVHAPVPQSHSALVPLHASAISPRTRTRRALQFAAHCNDSLDERLPSWRNPLAGTEISASHIRTHTADTHTRPVRRACCGCRVSNVQLGFTSVSSTPTSCCLFGRSF